MYKEDLALNNQQWLICHKTQPNPTNFLDFTSPSIPIIHHSQQGCSTRHQVSTRSWWIKVFADHPIPVYMREGLLENFIHEFMPVSSSLPSMPCSSYFYGLWDENEFLYLAALIHTWLSNVYTFKDIEFNSLSTNPGLFYAKRFGNCVHHTLVFTFFVLLFPKSFYKHIYIILSIPVEYK